MIVSRSPRVKRDIEGPDGFSMLESFVSNFGIDFSILNFEKSHLKILGKSICSKKDIVGLKDENIFFSGEVIANIDKKIVPSLNLLKEIANFDVDVITLNDKASFLFICGRDILDQGVKTKIILKNSKFGIVKNDKNEIIGVFQKKGKEYENLWNIGDYLKREMSKEN